MTPHLTNRKIPKPHLRVDISMLNLVDLPSFSTGPRGTLEEQLAAIREAGFEGVQGSDIAEAARRAGLRATAMATIWECGLLDPMCRKLRDEGYDCLTIHLGTGLESQDDARRLLEDVLSASSKTGFPVFVETHRATLTQDIWRTVEFVREFPEVRLNADFSHWYCGLEMTYGDWQKKMDFLSPVFERTRFVHGRIANSSCMQVDVGDGTSGKHVEDFRDLWTRAFRGFLSTATPGEFLVFAPELLWPAINYARVFPDGDGAMREETDRWEQALVLARIARECFAAAEENSGNRSN